MKKEPMVEEIKTFFKGLIVILTPDTVRDIEDQYNNKYFRYKLQNNYVYFINF